MVKKFVQCIIVGLLFLCCCTSNSSSSKTTNEFDWHNEVILPYAKAFNEVAKVSPIIGGDTETEWAAYQIDSLYQRIKIDNVTFPEKIANIHKMQSYMAYGITYFLSMIGMYYEPDVANQACHICFYADSTYNELEKVNFKNIEELSISALMSLGNYNYYFTLYNATMENPVYNEEGHLSMIGNIYAETKLLYKSHKDKEQAYRLSSIIEQSAFFMTMCPLIQSLQLKEQYYQTHDSIIAYAHWFDSHTQPIEKKIQEDKINEIQNISEEEYFTFMKEATIRKVAMLGFLKEAIESRKVE